MAGMQVQANNVLSDVDVNSHISAPFYGAHRHVASNDNLDGLQQAVIDSRGFALQATSNNGLPIQNIDIKVDDLNSLGSGVERIGSDHEINMINTISPIDNNRVTPTSNNA